MRALLLILALLVPGSCADPDGAPTADPPAAEVSETAETASPNQTPEAVEGAETVAAQAPKADEPAPEEPVAAPKSPAQIACERRGGRFTPISSGSTLMTCLKTTKDFTRQCSSGRDCEGVCLARSRTCAPVVPLLGCNDVVLDGGLIATECIR